MWNMNIEQNSIDEIRTVEKNCILMQKKRIEYNILEQNSREQLSKHVHKFLQTCQHFCTSLIHLYLSMKSKLFKIILLDSSHVICLYDQHCIVTLLHFHLMISMKFTMRMEKLLMAQNSHANMNDVFEWKLAHIVLGEQKKINN